MQLLLKEVLILLLACGGLALMWLNPDVALIETDLIADRASIIEGDVN